MAMSNFEEMTRAQRPNGPATILAIGTANPEKYILQADFPDWFFRVTNSEHKTDLKNRFKKLCDRTKIEKRHFYLTEEILKENPNIGTYMGTSLDARQDMLIAEVPKLGKAAALAAIKEWDRPMSEITHLIFNSTGGVDMPGADYRLIKLLGLSPSVKRIMMYQQGCFMGTTVLRIAKDIAENNRGARVLVVFSEITLPNFRGLPEDDVLVDQPLPNGNGPEMFVEMEKNTDHVSFQGPSKAQLDTMIGQALFGDGAAALIIGADPDLSVEKPLFQIVHATQNILPDSEGYIEGHLREAGLTSQVKNVPKLLANNIEKGMMDTLAPFGIEDWNSLFWITHPGGPAILDKVEQTLGLHEDRMKAAREVLKEYGNMWSASVLFIMDRMRKMSKKEGKKTTGEGMEWGVVVGFGAGVTVETVVLKAVRI